MTLFHYASLFVIVLTLYGIAVGSYPAFRMNRATIALVGAAVLIFIGSINLEQAYDAIDLNTILLLFSMMIINGNLRICGFFKLLTSKIISLAKTPHQLLALIIFSSGILSAFFLNDTIVIIFTPLVIEVTLALKRNPIPYLIALVTAANIGSSATIIGNPQNMIIGVSSGITFAKYALYQTPPALTGLVVIWIIIGFIYKKEFDRVRFEKLELEKVKPYRPLLIKSIVSSVLMIIAFFFGIPVTLAAFGAASLLLITRRLKPERVFLEIDWSLLVFFSALFVVTKSIDTAGFGRYLSLTLEPYITKGITSFAVSSALLSNIVSNVPAVLLYRPIIPKLINPDQAWMILGMATTFAGNLTLIGSVANLIVAETAKKHFINLSFVEYLKSGLIITIISLLLGILWFSFIF
ncbi:MAG: anion transporter [Ignavibacteria bacterium]|nr:anion transporter [Ignavibacteria bacterium]